MNVPRDTKPMIRGAVIGAGICADASAPKRMRGDAQDMSVALRPGRLHR
jgi:hypothetical protein